MSEKNHDPNMDPKRFKRPAEDILTNPIAKARKIETSPKTKFLAICMKCFSFGQNTTGEVAEFSYEHMCDTISGKEHKGLDDAIKILEEKRSVLTQHSCGMQKNDQKEDIPDEKEPQKVKSIPPATQMIDKRRHSN